MPKTGTADDNVFGDVVKEEPKRGRQEDGTYVTSSGETLAAKEPKREPYPEPEEKQVDGNEELVESPDGKIAFSATRMDDQEYALANRPERKRLQCRYRLVETYAGQPRPHYSYDELEQLRKGELKR